MDFPINQSYWLDMDEDQKHGFTRKIFQHYRENGFPHYNLSIDKQIGEIKKIQKRCLKLEGSCIRATTSYG